MNKTALILSTALVTTRPDFPAHDRRVRQYLNGFEQVAQVCAKYAVFDVYSMDSTVENAAALDPALFEALQRIPGYRGSFHFWDNDLGRINRGWGLMVQWMHALPQIADPYEYILHYEPRQDMLNDSFFARVAAQPGNYCCVMRDHMKLYGIPMTFEKIWTGCFCLKLRDLRGYCAAEDRRMLPPAKPLTSLQRGYRAARDRVVPAWVAGLFNEIEYDFARYLRRHNVPYERIAHLGVRWHFDLLERWFEMKECDFLADWTIIGESADRTCDRTCDRT